MKNSKSNAPRISEGVLLALLSAGAYLLAYYYEKGYASAFNIPTSFINISLSSILTFGTILVGLILFLMPFINFFFMVTVGRIHPALLRAIIPIAFIFIFLLIQVYFFGFQTLRDWYLVLIYVVVFSLLQLAFPLIQSGKTYVSKLEAQEKIDGEVVDAYALIQNKFGKDSLLVIIAFILGMYIALSAGRAEAINQKDFLVTNSTPELVVLRIYGDNLICVPFDRITGEIEQNFSVIKNTGDISLALKLEELGQLHLPTATPSAITTLTPLPIETVTHTIPTP